MMAERIVVLAVDVGRRRYLLMVVVSLFALGSVHFLSYLGGAGSYHVIRKLVIRHLNFMRAFAFGEIVRAYFEAIQARLWLCVLDRALRQQAAASSLIIMSFMQRR